MNIFASGDISLNVLLSFVSCIERFLSYAQLLTLLCNSDVKAQRWIGLSSPNCVQRGDHGGQSKQRREQHGRNGRSVCEETVRSFRKTLSMKDPVKALFPLLMHGLFQNRPVLLQRHVHSSLLLLSTKSSFI